MDEKNSMLGRILVIKALMPHDETLPEQFSLMHFDIGECIAASGPMLRCIQIQIWPNDKKCNLIFLES
jgi:hypothetical protein